MVCHRHADGRGMRPPSVGISSEALVSCKTNSTRDRFVWNNLMVKDPDSGNRLSHPNPERECQTMEILDLAIVPEALFAEARYRKNARGRTHPNQQRRP